MGRSDLFPVPPTYGVTQYMWVTPTGLRVKTIKTIEGGLQESGFSRILL